MLALASPILAQTTDEYTDEKTEIEIAEEEEAIESDSDGSLDDAMNSIDVKNKLEGVGLSGDIRIRQRKEPEQQALTVGKNEDLDVFLRLTWGGTIK
jgi:hypothetical protein